jgi:hypothetical protein
MDAIIWQCKISKQTSIFMQWGEKGERGEKRGKNHLGGSSLKKKKEGLAAYRSFYYCFLFQFVFNLSISFNNLFSVCLLESITFSKRL